MRRTLEYVSRGAQALGRCLSAALQALSLRWALVIFLARTVPAALPTLMAIFVRASGVSAHALAFPFPAAAIRVIWSKVHNAHFTYFAKHPGELTVLHNLDRAGAPHAHTCGAIELDSLTIAASK